ncbi:MAG: hypothetical protein GW848_04955 [Rhodoferax sp.]|nr:hypothetical protein [Rhodoferax sp.]NCP53561.1 hypothetical protein [Rhodoferax sp.]
MRRAKAQPGTFIHTTPSSTTAKPMPHVAMPLTQPGRFVCTGNRSRALGW